MPTGAENVAISNSSEQKRDKNQKEIIIRKNSELISKKGKDKLRRYVKYIFLGDLCGIQIIFIKKIKGRRHKKTFFAEHIKFPSSLYSFA